MNPGTVRSDKNRKRRNAEAEKEMELNDTRETIQLLNAVVAAYKSVFPPEKQFSRILDIKTAAMEFLSLIPSYAEISDEDKEVLINHGLHAFLVGSRMFFLNNYWKIVYREILSNFIVKKGVLNQKF